MYDSGFLPKVKSANLSIPILKHSISFDSPTGIDKTQPNLYLTAIGVPTAPFLVSRGQIKSQWSLPSNMANPCLAAAS